MEWNIGCVLTGVNRWKVSGACELSEDGVSFMLSGRMNGFPCTGLFPVLSVVRGNMLVRKQIVHGNRAVDVFAAVVCFVRQETG